MTTERLDSQFEMIADEQRRAVLVSLLERSRQDDGAIDGSVSMGTEGGQCAVSMVHVHLPKLAESGYVTWDREDGSVARGPEFDTIEPLLELLVEHENELPEHVAVA